MPWQITNKLQLRSTLGPDLRLQITTLSPPLLGRDRRHALSLDLHSVACLANANKTTIVKRWMTTGIGTIRKRRLYHDFRPPLTGYLVSPSQPPQGHIYLVTIPEEAPPQSTACIARAELSPWDPSGAFEHVRRQRCSRGLRCLPGYGAEELARRWLLSWLRCVLQQYNRCFRGRTQPAGRLDPGQPGFRPTNPFRTNMSYHFKTIQYHDRRGAGQAGVFVASDGRRSHSGVA